MDQGTVLRIEKISPHDGQGLRTVVFLKGCPFRCAWCSTPESQSVKPELFYKQAKCQHCGRCIISCPQKALSVSADRTAVARDLKKCNSCFQCVSVCMPHAMGIYGTVMTVEQVMKEIQKETLFYFYSGGGVTLSGGDVLLQAEFAREILKACREDCIHTIAELDMYGPYENITKVMEYLNSCYVDIKLMDEESHRNWTGVKNSSILQNTLRASKEFPHIPMNVRVPLIFGVNDSETNILTTAQFCKELPSCKSLEFLPYHRLGAAAYQYTGRIYRFAEMSPMSFEQAHERIRFLQELELPFEMRVSGRPLESA